jgi:hypothetical protein
MSKAHFIMPSAPQAATKTVRLGTTGAKFNQSDANKFVKLSAESAYDLCAAGDPIEAVVSSVDTASAAGYSVGGIYGEGRAYAVADGLQATPGTGTLAVGDYVVCGTVVAKNTAQTGFAKVCKATAQPGAVPATLAEAGQQIKNGMFAWRVVSLGSVGTGAVGTTIVIERVNAASAVVA